jgi:hypothetical protein
MRKVPPGIQTMSGNGGGPGAGALSLTAEAAVVAFEAITAS